MRLTTFIEILFRKYLPSPFSISIFLTIISIILAITLTDSKFSTVLTNWENGLWNPKLMTFTTQMILMLVLGYVLGLTQFVNNIIAKITKLCHNNSYAAATVSFFSILVSLLNWGLGLIFGAILARKVAEYASKKNIKINYPLIGAAGYSGLMVWHGGLSGSAPLKIAEKNHFNDIISNPELLTSIPENLDLSYTIFSTMNIIICLALLIIIPLTFFLLGKKVKTKKINLPITSTKLEIKKNHLIGAEKIDVNKLFGWLIGCFILFVAIQKGLNANSLSFIDPNYINLILLGLAILLHGKIIYFLESVKEGIKNAAGILIQFPIYFGIMAILSSSGLIDMISDFFVNFSTKDSFPIYTMISSGIVNIFVPSGGGQWAIQGPMIIQASTEIGVPLHKSIMSLVYGDQLTNMLQPFWALPLLYITGLKAKDILPYTLLIMIIGFFIFLTGLILT